MRRARKWLSFPSHLELNVNPDERKLIYDITYTFRHAEVLKGHENAAQVLVVPAEPRLRRKHYSRRQAMPYLSIRPLNTVSTDSLKFRREPGGKLTARLAAIASSDDIKGTQPDQGKRE